jgi:hypothetical protein
MEAKAQLFSLATGEKCILRFQRSCVYAEGQLHSPKSGEGRSGGESNRLSLVERKDLAEMRFGR